MGAALSNWLAASYAKVIAVALALILALGGGAFLMYRHYAAKVAALETQVVAAQLDGRSTKAAITAKAGAQAQVESKYTQRDKEVSNALQTSPEWAAAPVPDAVFDSLFPGTGKAPAAR